MFEKWFSNIISLLRYTLVTKDAKIVNSVMREENYKIRKQCKIIDNCDGNQNTTQKKNIRQKVNQKQQWKKI